MDSIFRPPFPIFYDYLAILNVCIYGNTYIKSMDQPDKVVNPARDQLNRENEYCPVPVRA